MSTIHFFARRITCGASTALQPSRSNFFRQISSGTIKENETVILERLTRVGGEHLFIPKLQHGKTSIVKGTKRLYFAHEHIIGREERALVTAKSGGPFYRVVRPTLAQYTDTCPRIVTPIYSQDAALIVSLLDLHPTHPGVEAEKIEIFEAGTGNGALTIQLSRAIHAANIPPPDTSEETKWDEWQSTRRAIVHTLDVSSKHSGNAKDSIANYRNGMYLPNIDFHVGEIDEYISQRLEHGGSATFLDRAILDLPGSDKYMKIVGMALKRNGTLITFVPNITQIMDEIRLVKKLQLPLWLDKVLEIGSQAGTGGREWDVRPVQPRAFLKTEAQARGKTTPETEEGTERETEEPSELDNSGAEEEVSSPPTDDGWEMICRPKVGLRTAGGGFLGVWKKQGAKE